MNSKITKREQYLMRVVWSCAASRTETGKPIGKFDEWLQESTPCGRTHAEVLEDFAALQTAREHGRIV